MKGNLHMIDINGAHGNNFMYNTNIFKLAN